FINDIIIAFNILEEYLEYLKAIFGLFTEKGIFISPKKFYLSYPNVELLSFKVNALGLIIIIKRITALKNLKFLN
ncbi:hypothetical protein B0T20DRAFT_349445, partial [Sordaria brevicollis]